MVFEKIEEFECCPHRKDSSDQRDRQQPHAPPHLVSALTGHVEGSRAISRYRTINIDMKKDLVKILEGKQ